jgi:hypothetical protein
MTPYILGWMNGWNFFFLEQSKCLEAEHRGILADGGSCRWDEILHTYNVALYKKMELVKVKESVELCIWRMKLTGDVRS